MYVCSRCDCDTEELFGTINDQEDLCESCADDRKEHRNNYIMSKCEEMDRDVKFLKTLGKNILPNKKFNEQESLKFMFLKKYLVILNGTTDCLCAGYSFKNKDLLVKELDSAVEIANWLIKYNCIIVKD